MIILYTIWRIYNDKRQLFNVLYERTSTRAFNPNKEISSTELHEILKAAAQAPSAWNLQHWKFLVFQGEDVQKRLHPIAYNQQQILDASAVVAILGDLEAYKNVEPVYIQCRTRIYERRSKRTLS